MNKNFLLALVFFSMRITCFSQKDSVKVNFSFTCDTITVNKFSKLMNQKIKTIKTNDDFSIAELLEIIKLGMTPLVQEKMSKRKRKIYQEFQTIYWEKMIGVISNNKEFGYAPLRGMVGYSKRFNMYITPPTKISEMPCHNYYHIR